MLQIPTLPPKWPRSGVTFHLLFEKGLNFQVMMQMTYQCATVLPVDTKL